MGIIIALVIVFIVYTKWFKKPKKIKPQIIVVAPYDGKKKPFYNVSYFYEKNLSAMLRTTMRNYSVFLSKMYNKG